MSSPRPGPPALDGHTVRAAVLSVLSDLTGNGADLADSTELGAIFDDSLDALEAAAALEERLGTRVLEALVTDRPPVTLGELVTVVTGHVTGPR